MTAFMRGALSGLAATATALLPGVANAQGVKAEDFVYCAAVGHSVRPNAKHPNAFRPQFDRQITNQRFLSGHRYGDSTHQGVGNPGGRRRNGHNYPRSGGSHDPSGQSCSDKIGLNVRLDGRHKLIERQVGEWNAL